MILEIVTQPLGNVDQKQAFSLYLDNNLDAKLIDLSEFVPHKADWIFFLGVGLEMFRNRVRKKKHILITFRRKIDFQ